MFPYSSLGSLRLPSADLPRQFDQVRTRNSDRPAARATKGSTALTSVQLVGNECKRPSCPETRPCPHPSPGGRNQLELLLESGWYDVLLENVEFQHRHAAQLNTHANGIAERWVGSCRRDLLDHIVALNERHLKRLLSEYVRYHHEERTHLGLEKGTPDGRTRSAASGRVHSQERLGGLHHRYNRAA